MSDMKKTVENLLARKDKDRAWKIAELEKMHADARAAQRAGTESGMVADDDFESSLQEIDQALAVLGDDQTRRDDETNAATL